MKALTDSLLGLLPSSVTVYKGTVPALPKFPYVLAVVSVPSVSLRSQVGRRMLTTARLRCTVAGLSADSVMVIAPRVIEAFDGARVSPPGWVTGSVQSVPNDQPILEDLDFTDATTKLHPMYAVLEFLVTAS